MPVCGPRTGGRAVSSWAAEALLAPFQHALIDRREALVRAVDADFGGRAAEETLLAEVFAVANAGGFARRRLRRWARKRRVPVALPFWPGRAWVRAAAAGRGRDRRPWNYPVQLALLPLVAAIAAGNRAALKPSETTPRTAEELAALVEAASGAEVARTVLGGPEVAARLGAAAVGPPPVHRLHRARTRRAGRRGRASDPGDAGARRQVPCRVLPDADLERAHGRSSRQDT